MKLRVLIVGDGTFAVEVAKVIDELQAAMVVGVWASRGDKLENYALEGGIHSRDRWSAAQIREAGVDLMVSANNQRYLGEGIRSAARLGAIGYHPSLLPRHRGPDSIRWAIGMADPITGGTVFHLDNGMDTGRIRLQDWCWIRHGDDASALWRRDLFPMGVRLLRHAVVQISQDVGEVRDQLEEVATEEQMWHESPGTGGEEPVAVLPGWDEIQAEAAPEEGFRGTNAQRHPWFQQEPGPIGRTFPPED